MASSSRFFGLSPALFATLVACGGAAVAAAVACSSTGGPGAGTSYHGTESTSSGGSSSGGIDAAAAPAGPIDCGPSPGKASAFSKHALLTAASECAAWHACTFLNAATALRTSVHDQAAAPSEDNLGAARVAWKNAMNEWSKMELFQFGPVGSKLVDKYHGRGLRSFVHPWPDVNRCQVEAQIANQGYSQGIETVLPSGRGLFAIEYILFYPGADTACLPGSATGQAWAGLGPEPLAKAKLDYGSAVADNLVALALEIRNVWQPEGEDFAKKLTTFEGYGNEQETLNVVAWSLMYPHTELKDYKLGSLAGVRTTPPTPETPFALIEIENVRTNLRTFRELFQGCSEDGTGIGFDDWLIAAGHAELAGEMLAALAQAQAAADAFPAFSEATQPEFVSLYQAVKTLSDLLKTSFFGSASPLNLKLPATAASDTD